MSSLWKQGHIFANAARGPVNHGGGAGIGRLLQIWEMMKRSRKVGDTGLRLWGGLIGV